jgi:hypothetical protein
MVLVNMLNAEEVMVTTSLGGGRAGPLRIDMQRGRACLQARTCFLSTGGANSAQQSG